jgi:cell division protein ZapE
MILNTLQNELLELLSQKFAEQSKFKIFRRASEISSGVYIYGGVGTGKTATMKSFYDKQDSPNSKFLHYQQLVKIIHSQNSNISNHMSYVTFFAKDYFKNIKLLCIDEVEIKDPADAVIIYSLLAELIKNKVFIVCSSNFHPQDFKKAILNVDLIEPLIGLLIRNFILFHLDSAVDYRKANSPSGRIVVPGSASDSQKFLSVVNDLTAKYPQATVRLENFGRKIIFHNTFGRILITDFAEICVGKFSYSDYISICEYFDIIVIEHIPLVSSNDSDLIIRLIHLVDNIYFYKVLLFATLAAVPEKIYTSGSKLFEFNRTASRLVEIDSVAYFYSSKAKLYNINISN